MSLRVLTLPYHRGGFSLPDFKLYYLVAQCSYAHAWYHTDSKLPFLCPETDLVLPNGLASVLPTGYPRDRDDIQTVSTTSWAWLKLARLMQWTSLYSSALPLPNPRWIPATGEALVQRTLTKYDLAATGDLYPGGHVFSLDDDTRFIAATFMDSFVLTRIRSTIRTLLPNYLIEPSSFDPLTTVITSWGGAPGC